MAFLYPLRVWIILISLIVTGAARSIGVKFLYQSGFEYPFLVTILYLLGQALALPIHWVLSRLDRMTEEEIRGNTFHELDDQDDMEPAEEANNDGSSKMENQFEKNVRASSVGLPLTSSNNHSAHTQASNSSLPATSFHQMEKGVISEDDDADDDDDIERKTCPKRPSRRTGNGLGRSINHWLKNQDNNESKNPTRGSTVQQSAATIESGSNLSTFTKLSAIAIARSRRHSSFFDMEDEDQDSTAVGQWDLVSPSSVTLPNSDVSVSDSRHSTASIAPRHGTTLEQSSGRPKVSWMRPMSVPENTVVSTKLVELGEVLEGHDDQASSKLFTSTGSVTGLTEKSQEASKKWLKLVPAWARPIIPSIFNLGHAAFRCLALVFVAASVNEIFISGMELLLSVLMARFVRKRDISLWRWGGVSIVTLGLSIIVVGTLTHQEGETSEEDGNDDRGHAPQWLGFLLLIGKCLFAAMQDITEEIFMHEGNIPAALLLGIEGCLGLVFTIPLYFGLARFLGEDPMVALGDLFGNGTILAMSIVVTIVFTVAGIFNVVATAVTSSMTRNVWKNMRPLLVWVVGLVIYYSSTGEDRLGEAWMSPRSYFVLAGFALIVSGVGVYYVESVRPTAVVDKVDAEAKEKPET